MKQSYSRYRKRENEKEKVNEEDAALFILSSPNSDERRRFLDD
ncbi:hypothetical protein JNUCC1_02672 [Lentibacillus sp. JNUCC-1]|nr:hypothetical protein [Lentibacillus sp. JNUCC-1]MUV38801.1 hypothetical protein [Lentibacillus sp. JNUCC-1]